MQRASPFGRLSFSLGAGALIGILVGAVHGALLLTFVGFWGGLMWLLLLGGPLGLWVAAKKLHGGGDALAFGLGIAVGLAPWAFYEWHSRHDLNGNEVWFPITLSFLAGLMISPVFLAIRRSRSRGLSPNGR
jgi:hypothetical protein